MIFHYQGFNTLSLSSVYHVTGLIYEMIDDQSAGIWTLEFRFFVTFSAILRLSRN